MEIVSDFINIALRYNFKLWCEEVEIFQMIEEKGKGDIILKNQEGVSIYLALKTPMDKLMYWKNLEVSKIFIGGSSPFRSVELRKNGVLTKEKYACDPLILNSLSISAEDCTEEIFERMINAQLDPQGLVRNNIRILYDDILPYLSTLEPTLERFGFTQGKDQDINQLGNLYDVGYEVGGLMSYNLLIPSFIWGNKLTGDYLLFILNPIMQRLEVRYEDPGEGTGELFYGDVSEFEDWLMKVCVSKYDDSDSFSSLKYKYIVNPDYPKDAYSRILGINKKYESVLRSFNRLHLTVELEKSLVDLLESIYDSGVPVTDRASLVLWSNINQLIYALRENYERDNKNQSMGN